MTALGPIRLRRQYLWNACERGFFPADSALGIAGFLSLQATRLLALAGLEESFAKAQRLVREMCGWKVDEEVIRQTTHAQCRRAQAERSRLVDVEAFAAAPGSIEVAIDAGKVNTLSGWRDVKIAVFQRRLAGSAVSVAASVAASVADMADWRRRVLPAPGACVVVAAIEEAERFGQRLGDEANRLQATGADDVTVLGDGAEWIWNIAAERLPQAAEVLDVFHALEHVADAAKSAWGEGTPAARKQQESASQALIAHGKAGLERWLSEAFAQAPQPLNETAAEALRNTAAYFAKHPTRLNYAERLEQGRSIGSGAVEGMIKQQINLRMKRTGARWRAENVGPFVQLRHLSQTAAWNLLWTTA